MDEQVGCPVQGKLDDSALEWRRDGRGGRSLNLSTSSWVRCLAIVTSLLQVARAGNKDWRPSPAGPFGKKVVGWWEI